MIFQKITWKFLALAVIATGLAACDTPPQRQQFPQITFQHMAPFNLDVGSVQIAEGYRPQDNPDDISGDFPESPAAAVAQWARDRLKAAGARGQADFTVVEAKATRTPLPRSTGLNAALNKDQSDRYDLAIEVQLNAFNPLSGKSGSVSERVTRSQTVAEDLTLNQREVVLFNLLDSAMKDLNARLEQSIPQYLGPLLLR